MKYRITMAYDAVLNETSPVMEATGENNHIDVEMVEILDHSIPTDAEIIKFADKIKKQADAKVVAFVGCKKVEKLDDDWDNDDYSGYIDD